SGESRLETHTTHSKVTLLDLLPGNSSVLSVQGDILSRLERFPQTVVASHGLAELIWREILDHHFVVGVEERQVVFPYYVDRMIQVELDNLKIGEFDHFDGQREPGRILVLVGGLLLVGEVDIHDHYEVEVDSLSMKLKQKLG